MVRDRRTVLKGPSEKSCQHDFSRKINPVSSQVSQLWSARRRDRIFFRRASNRETRQDFFRGRRPSHRDFLRESLGFGSDSEANTPCQHPEESLGGILVESLGSLRELILRNPYRILKNSFGIHKKP